MSKILHVVCFDEIRRCMSFSICLFQYPLLVFSKASVIIITRWTSSNLSLNSWILRNSHPVQQPTIKMLTLSCPMALFTQVFIRVCRETDQWKIRRKRNFGIWKRGTIWRRVPCGNETWQGKILLYQRRTLHRRLVWK